MSGRRAKKIRKAMTAFRMSDHPVAKKMTQVEAEHFEKCRKPISPGMVRRWTPPYRNPTRAIKKLASQFVLNQ